MLRDNEHVKNLMKVEQAFVPVIKMLFHGVQIDLTFCKYIGKCLKKVTNEDFQKQENLKNLENASCRTLSGKNAIEKILSQFKDENRLQIFRQTLRCVKLFALNQGIYSNVFGYLGGISWAILLTRICKLYPNYHVNRLLERFFFFYHQWP